MTGVGPRPLAHRTAARASASAPVGPADIDTIFAGLLHSWFRAESAADFTIEAGDVASAWINRTGGGNAAQADNALRPAFDVDGFNGVPCITGAGTQFLLATLTTPLALGSRPYFIVVGSQNTLGVNDFWIGLGDGVVASSGFRVDSSNRYNGRLTLTGGSTETILVTGADTGRHLIEVGARETTANKLVVDGTGADGSVTTTLSAANNLFGILSGAAAAGSAVAAASLAEIILLSAIPTDEQLTAARVLLASEARGYGLSLA